MDKLTAETLEQAKTDLTNQIIGFEQSLLRARGALEIIGVLKGELTRKAEVAKESDKAPVENKIAK